MKIVSVAQMQELERSSVAAGVSLDALMDNAGLAIARRITQIIDGIKGKRVVVLVGPGNNGGDGMVAARYLADWGALITLYMTTARRREDRLEECRTRRVRVTEAVDDMDQWQLMSYVPLADAVVDAVLGIGNERPLDPLLSSIFTSLAKLKAEEPALRYIAVDVPTGLQADTGVCDEACFQASVTLTLGAPKLGLYRFPGADHVGRIDILPIGLPDDAGAEVQVELADAMTVAPLLPKRPLDGHKGSFGSVLVLAGSRRFIGAPVLAATAAYRAGAGIVTLAAPESAYRLAASSLLEQVHLPLPETPDGYAAAEGAGIARAAMEGASAAVIGPGLGDSESVRQLLQALLLSGDAPQTPTVIDADALNALAKSYGWWEQLTTQAVLTPHPGEMARLLSRPVTDIQQDRLATATAAAAHWGQVVVLKGAHTVVADPGGKAAINPFANPTLATAGTGDVLSGIIGALLAQGLAPYDAALAGVHLHAEAGERASAEIGASGLLASDLLSEIPKATQALRAMA
jgi:hydroxyethylthiazole kinase-like uncharacterized protein yjeF